ncbi:MAG: hypothetical protein IPJ65_25040 [Archangiaceae bacterium]|nr:hypothetical protein [Archangiaceae bacterium]
MPNADANRSISLRKLVAFAPAPVAAALAEQAETQLTVADVEALAARFQDTEEFDSKAYLKGVLENLGAPAAPVAKAPPDPITAEAEAAAEKARQLREAAAAIEAATGMAAVHAELYASAGFTVEQSTRGWKAGLPGGQALMFTRLGVSVDDTIALGAAKVDARAAYSLVEKKVPPAQIPAFIEKGLVSENQINRYLEPGFTYSEIVELLELGISPDKVPARLSLAQVKQVLAEEQSLGSVDALTRDGTFTFEQALQVAANAAASRDVRGVTTLFAGGKLTLPELLSLYGDEVFKPLLRYAGTMVGAGFSVAQLRDLATSNVSLGNTLGQALSSGYSNEELIEMWKEGLGISSLPSASNLEDLHALGFTVAQLREVPGSGIVTHTLKQFARHGMTADDVLTVARAGYGSAYDFEKAYLDLGMTPREAVDLIRSGG